MMMSGWVARGCACGVTAAVWLAPALVLGQPAADACGQAATRIGEIQGAGASSPRAGSTLSVEAVVVGDFQATGLKGFFLQEEDAQQDSDPKTSEGLFVYQGRSTVAVAPGDLVRVSGKIVEFDGLTELTDVTAITVCPARPRASAQALRLPLPEGVDLERYENMLVRFDQTLTVTGNYELGRYGALDLSANGRLWQPTQVASKGAPAQAVQLANNRRNITLDDGDSAQNPNPIPFKDAANTRRVGQTLASLTGILDQHFGGYRVQPTSAPKFSCGNPRPATPAISGRLRVASFNVLNFFSTIDDGQPRCGPSDGQECRGADSENELARQRAKLGEALAGTRADVIGLLELENNKRASLDALVAGLNAAIGGNVYAYVDTGTIGSDAIKVGLLYRPATVKPAGKFALLTKAVDPQFEDTLNRPVLAQTFSEVAGGARFTVAVNHWKSKGSDCKAVNDPDAGDGQGNCNLTRSAAANALLRWLAKDPTGSKDPDFLVLGDLNSYAKEDPIAALEAAGYRSLIAAHSGEKAYSFQFQSQFGTLDYAFASPSLAGQVSGAAEWHINADEPVSLDYNTEHKTDDPFNPNDPYRASDHDPLLVGLSLTATH